MDEKKITIKIDKLGKPTIEAHGFEGCGCTEATKPIEQAFQGAPMERVEKPEMFHVEQEGESEQQMTI